MWQYVGGRGFPSHDKKYRIPECIRGRTRKMRSINWSIPGNILEKNAWESHFNVLPFFNDILSFAGSKSREMSARGHVPHSVCSQLSFFSSGINMCSVQWAVTKKLIFKFGKNGWTHVENLVEVRSGHVWSWSIRHEMTLLPPDNFDIKITVGS